MTNEEFIKSITLDGEEWRNVVGYEKFYYVSNYGRIASKQREVRCFNGIKTIKQRLLKQTLNKEGYLKVTLCNGTNRKVTLAHKIVAMAFIENTDNKPMIDHIDRNKQNNIVENLRWCTLSENMNNPLTVEHCRAMNIGREYKSRYKPVVALKNGIIVKQYDSIKSAIKDGYKGSAISNVCAGRYYLHRGYQWMFLSDYETLANQ